MQAAFAKINVDVIVLFLSSFLNGVEVQECRDITRHFHWQAISGVYFHGDPKWTAFKLIEFKIDAILAHPRKISLSVSCDPLCRVQKGFKCS